MSDFDIKIDPKSAEQGAKKVTKAFSDIEKAAEKLAKNASPRFSKVSKDVEGLSKLRGPSASLSANLRNLAQAMREIKAPSSTSIKNINALMKTFQGIKGPSAGTIAGINALKQALAGFQIPTATSVKNLRAMLSTLSNLKAPQGIQSVVVGLGQIATAARRANSAVSALGGSLRGIKGTNLRLNVAGAGGSGGGSGGLGLGGGSGGGRSFGSGAIKSLGGDFRILRSDSISLSAALLRTQVALQSLFAVMGVGKVIDVATQFQQVEAGLIAVTGTSLNAAKEMGFVRKISDQLGMSVLDTSQSFMQLLASIQGTQFSTQDAESIFSNMSKAARVLHLSVDDTNGVFRALTQIMSKNSLQSEELRGQLGDRLPGAFSKMAKAMGVSTAKLSDMMKKGQVTGQVLRDSLIKFAETFANDTAPGMEKAVKGLQASFGRLNTAFDDFLHTIAESGFTEAIQEISERLTNFFKSQDGVRFAIKLGEAFKFLVDNIDLIAKGLAALLAAGVLAKVFAGFTALAGAIGIGVAPLLAITAAIAGVGAALYALNKAFPSLSTQIEDTTDKIRDQNTAFEAHIKLMEHAKETDSEKFKSTKQLTGAIADQVKVQQALNKTRLVELQTSVKKQGFDVDPNALSNRYEKTNPLWRMFSGAGEYSSDPRTATQVIPGSGGRAQKTVPYTESDDYKKRLKDYQDNLKQLDDLQAEIKKGDDLLLRYYMEEGGTDRKLYDQIKPQEPWKEDTSSTSKTKHKADPLSDIRRQINEYKKLQEITEATKVSPQEVKKVESMQNARDTVEELKRGATSTEEFNKQTAEASKLLEAAGMSGKNLTDQLVALGTASSKVKEQADFNTLNTDLEKTALNSEQAANAMKDGTLSYDDFNLRMEAVNQLQAKNISLTEENIATIEDAVRAQDQWNKTLEFYQRSAEIRTDTEWLKQEIALRKQGLPDLERTLEVEKELFLLKKAGASDDQIAQRKRELQTWQGLMKQNDVLQTQADKLKQAAQDVGDAFTDAFSRIILKGESAREVFADLLMQLAEMAFRSAISPVLGGIFGKIFGAFSSPTASAKGNIYDAGKLQAFAKGGAFSNGVVRTPTLFNTGLMGEAGPEAIMPLRRTSTGELGVAGGGGAGNNISIVNNINVSGGSSGDSNMDQKLAEKIGKQVRSEMESTVYRIVDKESRPGGRFGPGLR